MKNNWKQVTPESRHIQYTNGRARSYVKNKG